MLLVGFDPAQSIVPGEINLVLQGFCIQMICQVKINLFVILNRIENVLFVD